VSGLVGKKTRDVTTGIDVPPQRGKRGADLVAPGRRDDLVRAAVER